MGLACTRPAQALRLGLFPGSDSLAWRAGCTLSWPAQGLRKRLVQTTGKALYRSLIWPGTVPGNLVAVPGVI